MDALARQSKNGYMRTYYHEKLKADPVARAAKAASAKRYRAANPTTRELWARRVLNAIRHRAKKDGVAFDLEPSDIRIPDVCPVFGTVFVFGRGRALPTSPSIDRVNPALGYVRGNVAVISKRANMLKGDATAGELRLLADWLAGVGN